MAPKVMASIAPERRARRDAQRERRGQRVPQHRLEDDARGGERRADERAGQHARQPRDEEDLRVDVVGERDRAIEGARQADGRAADERRERRRSTSASAPNPSTVSATRVRIVSRARVPRVASTAPARRTCPSRAARRQRSSSVRDAYGHHGQMPGPLVESDVGVDAVQLPHGVGRQHIGGRSLRQHPAVRACSTSASQSDAARFRSCVASTIVTPRSRLSRSSSAATSSW